MEKEGKNNGLIKTDVDELIELLKKNKKMPLSEAAKEMNIPKEILQKWVDFLVEEGIIGIEYKFTTPYIYLNEESIKSPAINLEEEIEMEGEELSIEDFKNMFLEKIPEDMAEKSKILDKGNLWKNHMWEVLKKKETFFINECNKRGIENPEEFWKEYSSKLLKK